MSALAQPRRIITSAQPLEELEATHQISRAASQAVDTQEALDEIASLALRVEGIRSVNVEHRDALRRLANGPFRWGPPAGGVNEGSAAADVACGGSQWGTVRIGFHLRIIHLESPLRFARFVGEQMAGVIDRLGREKERATLTETVEQLRNVLASRKAIDRAQGIIAGRQKITHTEAGAVLRKYSSESGNDLRRVAEAVILSEQAGQDDACFLFA